MWANAISILIFSALLWGRSLRGHNTKMHAITMTSCFIADLLLVVALVALRNALSKVGAGMPPLLTVHITFALTTLVLYPLGLYTGWRLYKGNQSVRPKLRRLDKFLLLTRSCTLATSLALQTVRMISEG